MKSVISQARRMHFVPIEVFTILALFSFLGCEGGSDLVVESRSNSETYDSLGPEIGSGEMVGKRSWDPSGWQIAILREAKYALSSRADGSSSNIYRYGNGYYFVSDWDYVNSNLSALSLVRSSCSFPEASFGLWMEYNNSECMLVGHGGWCKFFANLVQWRATGGVKGCLPPNIDASGSIDWVLPSDIIQLPEYYGHTAIVIGVLERYPNGKVKTVDVIDCNYIGGDSRYIIARHPISQPMLSAYRTYH